MNDNHNDKNNIRNQFNVQAQCLTHHTPTNAARHTPQPHCSAESFCPMDGSASSWLLNNQRPLYYDPPNNRPPTWRFCVTAMAFASASVCLSCAIMFTSTSAVRLNSVTTPTKPANPIVTRDPEVRATSQGDRVQRLTTIPQEAENVMTAPKSDTSSVPLPVSAQHQPQGPMAALLLVVVALVGLVGWHSRKERRQRRCDAVGCDGVGYAPRPRRFVACPPPWGPSRVGVRLQTSLVRPLAPTWQSTSRALQHRSGTEVKKVRGQEEV